MSALWLSSLSKRYPSGPRLAGCGIIDWRFGIGGAVGAGGAISRRGETGIAASGGVLTGIDGKGRTGAAFTGVDMTGAGAAGTAVFGRATITGGAPTRESSLTDGGAANVEQGIASASANIETRGKLRFCIVNAPVAPAPAVTALRGFLTLC
jgi:hypothetical protein